MTYLCLTFSSRRGNRNRRLRLRGRVDGGGSGIRVCVADSGDSRRTIESACRRTPREKKPCPERSVDVIRCVSRSVHSLTDGDQRQARSHAARGRWIRSSRSRRLEFHRLGADMHAVTVRFVTTVHDEYVDGGSSSANSPASLNTSATEPSKRRCADFESVSSHGCALTTP